jgi:hypothetical protein
MIARPASRASRYPRDQKSRTRPLRHAQPRDSPFSGTSASSTAGPSAAVVPRPSFVCSRADGPLPWFRHISGQSPTSEDGRSFPGFRHQRGAPRRRPAPRRGQRCRRPAIHGSRAPSATDSPRSAPCIIGSAGKGAARPALRGRAHGPPEFVAAKLDEPGLADRRNVESRKAPTTPPAPSLPESDTSDHAELAAPQSRHS